MSTSAFSAIRGAFFDRWRELHPEEASTLGIEDPEGRLADPSREAIEGEARALSQTLRELGALDPGSLDRQARLDAWAIESWSRHEVRRVERGAHLANVELGLLPYHLLRHLLAHHPPGRVASARARAIPAYLAAHERTLAAGLREGARAHAGTVEWIARRSLPAIVGAMDALAPELEGAREAARAYESHARFLAEEVLPAARASGAIGAPETRFRLAATLGLERDVDALVAEARAELERAHEQLLTGAARLPAFAGARDVQAVRTALGARYSELLAERDEDVVPAYRALVERATAFARAHGLVPLEGELAVRVAEMPAAIADASNAQNWAAPLTSPRPVADFLVARDARAHPAMAAPLLAVHEAVPGHALQSLAFARAHGSDPRPVRFVAIADDVAMARSYFGAMRAIEGWATWVEHRMLELGFYEGEAAVYAWNVRAIRAARVVADLGIHTAAMSPDEARAFLARDAFLPDGIAAREVERYQRVPLQALTYLTGALAIERALAAARARDQERAAIDELLAAGPVAPELAL